MFILRNQTWFRRSFRVEIEAQKYLLREQTNELLIEGYDLENERMAISLTGVIPQVNVHMFLVIEEEMKKGGSLKRIVGEFNAWKKRGGHVGLPASQLVMTYCVRTKASAGHVSYASFVTNLQTIKYLAKDPDQTVRFVLAANPHIPMEVWRSFYTGKDLVVGIKALENVIVPQDILGERSNDTNYCVRMAVARNPSTPGILLSQMLERELRRPRVVGAEFGTRQVIEAIASNVNFPQRNIQ